MRKEWRRKETRPPGLEPNKDESQGQGASLNQFTQHVDGGNRHGSGRPPRMDANNDNSSTSKWRGAQEEDPSPLSPATPSTPKPRRSRRRRNVNRDSFNRAGPEVGIGISSSLANSSGAARLKEVQIGEKCIEAVVTADSQIAERWVQRQTGKLFGMDLEWKPNFIKGQDNRAALLQLCGDRDCLILQLFYLDAMPGSLLQFLNDSQIRLAGVEISSDADKLAADYGFVCQGLVDLPTLAVDRLGRPDLKHAGLKVLAAQVLGLSLVKPKRITVSNWQTTELSSSQIDYACTDAYISFAIAQNLMEHH